MIVEATSYILFVPYVISWIMCFCANSDNPGTPTSFKPIIWTQINWFYSTFNFLFVTNLEFSGWEQIANFLYLKKEEGKVSLYLSSVFCGTYICFWHMTCRFYKSKYIMGCIFVFITFAQTHLSFKGEVALVLRVHQKTDFKKQNPDLIWHISGS